MAHAEPIVQAFVKKKQDHSLRLIHGGTMIVLFKKYNDQK